jgi:uncharacterized protein YecE (DUF72 family)
MLYYIMPTARQRCRVGISGWNYPPWRGKFYPEGLPQRRELEFASRQVNSIEINGTFYSLQRPESFRKWFEQTPDDFVFAIKGGRFITHAKRLKDVKTPLANFFASGLLALKHKLGPILWQLPPTLKYDPKILADFLHQLPRETAGAAKLAHKHDKRVSGRSVLQTDDEKRPIRHAMEVRHPSFENEEFVELLRKHEVALVVADTAGKWPFIEELTSDFIYVRLHGDEELYASGYGDKALDDWAAKIKSRARGGRDVYVYFDNDVKVHAPFDAISLGRRLGLPEPEALI